MLKRFNELNSTTYLSAANKAAELNQNNRSRRLSNFVFHEFIGKEINDSKITSINYSGSKKVIVIKLEDYSIITYDSDNDTIQLSNGLEELSRRDAVLLSKIVQKSNPNSKYKRINNFSIKGY